MALAIFYVNYSILLDLFMLLAANNILSKSESRQNPGTSYLFLNINFLIMKIISLHSPRRPNKDTKSKLKEQ